MTMAVADAPTRYVPPAGACDCHVHFYGDQHTFPPRDDAGLAPQWGGADEYRATMRRLGLERVVAVQSILYGFDNRCMLDGMLQIGAGARGVAVVSEHTPMAELQALDARGYFRPAAKKAKMVDKIRAVLTRPGFTSGELKVLRGVLASLDYFSPNEPRGTGYPARKADVDRKAHPEAMQRRPATPRGTPADE